MFYCTQRHIQVCRIYTTLHKYRFQSTILCAITKQLWILNVMFLKLLNTSLQFLVSATWHTAQVTRFIACPFPYNFDVVYKFTAQQKRLLASKAILNTFHRSHVVHASARQFKELWLDRNMLRIGLRVHTTNPVSSGPNDFRRQTSPTGHVLNSKMVHPRCVYMNNRCGISR